jgi:hypothetical protein
MRVDAIPGVAIYSNLDLMEPTQPITLQLREPSHDTEINVTSLTCTGTTSGMPVGAIPAGSVGPITTLVNAEWPLTASTPASKADLVSDPRLEDVPEALLKQATLLDRPKTFSTYYWAETVQPVKTATLKLDASALTRLITLVDTDEISVGNVYTLVDTQVVSEVQTRGWFQDWNRAVAPAVLAGWLTRAHLLELLREARRRVRRLRASRPRPVAAASRIPQQLDRLTNFISPHAPPSGLLVQCPARAAASHLTALA